MSLYEQEEDITVEENKKPEYSNVFLLFRVFNYDLDLLNNMNPELKGERSRAKLLNKHEKLVLKNPRYLKVKKQRRPFCHVEFILPDKEWFGIKNDGGNDKVFKKKRLDMIEHASVNYPQVVMIQIDMKTREKVYKFAKSKVGDQFSSTALFWNMFWAHYMNMPFMSFVNPKNKWYCTKLTIEFLLQTGLMNPKELSPLTSTVEDIFWWCYEKELKTSKKEDFPKYFIMPYKQFPTDLIQ